MDIIEQIEALAVAFGMTSPELHIFRREPDGEDPIWIVEFDPGDRPFVPRSTGATAIAALTALHATLRERVCAQAARLQSALTADLAVPK